MSVAVYSDPYKVPAAALAFLVHGIFFGLLYFSFSWQMQPPQGMVVDIWDSLPSEEEQPPVQAPPPPPAVVEPIEKLVEKPSTLPENPEIALRDKKRKAKDDKIKLEKIKAQKLAEKQAELAERRMDELERQARARSITQRKAQEESALATGKVVDEYVSRIAGKIRRYIVLPPGVSKTIKAEFEVVLLPSGEVLSANLAKTSGNAAYDNAVERAILKAQPLPLPPAEKNMFNNFRELRLKFSPEESK